MGVMFCLPGMYRNPILACDEDFFLEKLQWQQDFGLFIKYRELNFSLQKESTRDVALPCTAARGPAMLLQSAWRWRSVWCAT